MMHNNRHCDHKQGTNAASKVLKMYWISIVFFKTVKMYWI